MANAPEFDRVTLNDLDWSTILDHLDRALPGYELRAVYCQTDQKGPFQMVSNRGFTNPSFASRLGFELNETWSALFETASPLILRDVQFFKDHPFDRQGFHLFRFASGGKLPVSSIFLPVVHTDTLSRALIILDAYESKRTDNGSIEKCLTDIQNSVNEQVSLSAPIIATPEEPLRAINSVLNSDLDQENIEELLIEVSNKLGYLIEFDQIHVWYDPKEPIVSTNAMEKAEVKVSALVFGRSIRNFIERGVPLTDHDPRLPKELSLLADQYAHQLIVPLRPQNNSALLIALQKHQGDPFTEADTLQADLFAKFFHASTGKREEKSETTDQSKQQARNAAVIEAMFDGAMITDAVNKIQFINSALRDMLSLEKQADHELTIESFSARFGQDLDEWKDHILTWSLNAQFEDAKPNFTGQIELKNGRVLLLHSSPIVMDSAFLGTVSIFRDVTYEVAFDRLKTDFITSISHELRTPLTSISGYIDLMLMGAAGELADEQRGFMGIIKNNSSKLSNLINDLLELTTIEAGNYQLRAQPFDLVAVARETARRVEKKPENAAKNLKVVFEHVPNLPLVFANQDRAIQIIDNLITNACMYSAKDGLVNVKLQETEEYLRVSVHNQNVVVPPEHEAIIFDKFYRGDDPSVQILQGSGLGLPIIKQLVELQQGKIWVSNDQHDPGSTFVFTLPIWNEEAMDG